MHCLNRFGKSAAGSTMKCILRCNPTVREMNYKNLYKLKFEWGKITVRDRYHAIICDHCQKHGHLEFSCTAKTNGEAKKCFKCTASHNSRGCAMAEKKCINFVRYKKPEINLPANDKCCRVP